MPPRVFDRLLRFLDNTIPAGPSTPSKRKGQASNHSRAAETTPSKRSRQTKDAEIEPQLKKATSPVQKDNQKLSSNLVDGSSSGADLRNDVFSRGSPRWLSKFILRLHPKLQSLFPGHVESGILQDGQLLDRIVRAGVTAANLSPAEPSDEADTSESQASKSNTPSIIIAVLTVVLEQHLGKNVVNVRDVARLAAQELAAGGIVKMSAFGGVLGDAQDLVGEKGDEWRDSAWCNGQFENVPGVQQAELASQDFDMTDVVAAEHHPPPTSSARPSAQIVEEEEDADESEYGIELAEVPLSRCGPMAQAHTDWLSPARRWEYSQWKAKMMKRIAAMEKQQAHSSALATV